MTKATSEMTEAQRGTHNAKRVNKLTRDKKNKSPKVKADRGFRNDRKHNLKKDNPTAYVKL